MEVCLKREISFVLFGKNRSFYDSNGCKLSFIKLNNRLLLLILVCRQQILADENAISWAGAQCKSQLNTDKFKKYA